MYPTSDFYSAVILRTWGFPLVSIEPEKHGSKRMVFTFDSGNMKKSPDDILARHWDGNLLLSSRKFIEAINELKTRVYDK